MRTTDKKVIAVVGATGQQGGAVVRALQAGKQFTVRALTRNPAKHRDIADDGPEPSASYAIPTSLEIERYPCRRVVASVRLSSHPSVHTTAHKMFRGFR
jgi:nucleoside-diphosphate-sugar epimerase